MPGQDDPDVAQARDRHQRDRRVVRTRTVVPEVVREILIEEGWEAVNHSRVAERSGLSRVTIWRHWPTRTDLLHDALAAEAAVPITVELSDDLRRDLIAVLELLRSTLVDEQLGKIMAMLADRSEWEREIHDLKVALVRDGFPTTRQILQSAIDNGELRASLDLDHGVAQLAGPLFYRRLCTGEPITTATIESTVDDFLAAYRTNTPAQPPNGRPRRAHRPRRKRSS